MTTATRAPALVSTAPLSDGSRCLGFFTFADGVTVRQSGGLVCSQHGRRHCSHHKAAHAAIIAQAVSSEAAPAMAERAARALPADHVPETFSIYR